MFILPTNTTAVIYAYLFSFKATNLPDRTTITFYFLLFYISIFSDIPTHSSMLYNLNSTP